MLLVYPAVYLIPHPELKMYKRFALDLRIIYGPESRRWGKRHFMQNTKRPVPEFYTEAEVAEALGISISRLHWLLDENIFNDGSVRPADLTFNSSDITLLNFWHRGTPNPKVVRMPRRF
jgi:hypothetical protein